MKRHRAGRVPAGAPLVVIGLLAAGCAVGPTYRRPEAPMPSQLSVTAPRAFDGVVRKAMAKRPKGLRATSQGVSPPSSQKESNSELYS